MDRKKHRTLRRGHRKIFHVQVLWVLWSFLLLLFSGSPVVAQIQYDINDPRNPDCPCHKMQKEADKEFALLNAAKQQERNVKMSFEKDNNQKESGRVPDINSPGKNSGTGNTFQKTKKRRKMLPMRNKYFRSFNIHRGIKKLRPDYRNCFQW
jgi:hypothetical protein